MWEHVDLRELRTFLTLCEELHFGRAADRLDISQGRVTQIIKQLEVKLGSPLFERTSRRVSITPSGERLRERLAPVLADLERTMRDADANGPALGGDLRLGLVVPASGGGVLPAITARFHREHLGCRCSIVDIQSRDALAALRRGDVDVMAIRGPVEQPGITVGPVLTWDRRALAVAVDHPLATRTSITLEDVADYPLVDTRDFLPPETARALTPSHTPNGRPLQLVPAPASDLMGTLIAVARGDLVHLTVASMKTFLNHPGYTVVPVDDMPISHAVLLWLSRRDRDPAITAFAAIAQSVVAATVDPVRDS